MTIASTIGRGALAATKFAGRAAMGPLGTAAAVASLAAPMLMSPDEEMPADDLTVSEVLDQQLESNDSIDPPKVDIERISSSGHIRIAVPEGMDAGDLEASLASFTSPMVVNYKGKKQRVYTLTAREYERLRSGGV